jgi:hypothetical protein
MPTDSLKTEAETAQQRFDRVLSGSAFEGLRTILDRLSPDREKLLAAVAMANSYVDLVARLGYGMNVVRQIHVQDCYSRLSPEGGIRAVLPYHDIPTQSSLPTLVNFDRTVTATIKSAAFFEALLLELNRQSRMQS